jgi:hypothetical protein
MITFTTGSLMAMWAGRLMCAIVFLSGTVQLLPPPTKPTTGAVLAAIGIYLAAMVFLTIGEFIAFYLAVLATLPTNITGVSQAQTVQAQIFDLISKAATSFKNIFPGGGDPPLGA